MSLRALPPALAAKALAELNEDPKRVNDDIQSIKNWIAKQPHLNARTDDQWLLTFLRGGKFSLERTKEKLDLYYTLRSTAPEFFRIKHTDPIFEEILNLGAITILPKVAGPDSPRVMLMRPGKMDTNKYHFLDVFSTANVLMRLMLLEDDHATVAGGQNILDLEGVTIAHFLQMTPLTMKKMMTLGQDASPLRMKGSHYLNMNPAFESFFNLMKSMLNEKNKKRIYIYNKDYQPMYEHIPKEILPAEYGGNGGTIDEITEYWKNKVKEHSSWLDEDMTYGTDESKRIGRPKTSEDMFGVEGSFRQLEFD